MEEEKPNQDEKINHFKIYALSIRRSTETAIKMMPIEVKLALILAFGISAFIGVVFGFVLGALLL
jgi:hypothetical protein